MFRPAAMLALTILAGIFPPSVRADILWSDLDSRVIHATPVGSDILGGKVKRDDKASDVLYFKFHVDPLSDAANEPYYALFQLCEGNTNRLGVGNALEAWGFSAAYTSETGPSNKAATDAGEFNLKSAHPEAAGLGAYLPYELVKQGAERTIVFKVQYVPDGDDLVTVWLDPDLTHGASAESQSEILTTQFKANASFDQVRLTHGGFAAGGGGNGWMFRDMAIATSFTDFVVVRWWQTWWFFWLVALSVLGGFGGTVRFLERRRYLVKLRVAEQQHALQQERSRIAQDLHDELGSLLTRISLLGGLLQEDKHNPNQVGTHAEKIAQSADQTVRALEEIVWAVRPGSDTLQSLVEYIAHFASELFAEGPTRCRLDLPADVPPHPLPPDVRHNIFLIAKEALNNILKHAGARVVFLQVKTDGKNYRMLIADDGKGFDVGSMTADGHRNGLENMRRRAESAGGRLTMTSEPGEGTRVEFTADFTN